MSITDIQYQDNRPTDAPKNVIDYYARWETEAIKGDLDKNRVPLVNVCMNLTNDFNKSSIIRTNNAFLGSKVILVGKRRWDRRGAQGVHHYETIQHSEEFAPVLEHLKDEGYTVYAVDNTPEFNPTVIYDVDLPVKTAFVYGEEQRGLSKDIVALCDACVYIPQFGSVRSMNVGVASGIMMSEYTRRHRFSSDANS